MYFSKKFKQLDDIKHCFFSRDNGVSDGIYSSLNCGLGSNDKKENDLKNLKSVSRQMNIDENKLMLMNQTHGNKVILVDKNNIKIKKFNSDALITKMKGIGISVLTADCVPILLYEELNKVVGCIHAGWKGAFNGIIENTINQITALSENNIINAVIGPCIGKENYEVGEDFYKKFLDQNYENRLFFTTSTKVKYFFDLRGYINLKLKKLNVNYIENISLDTYHEKSNFFSYRRSIYRKEKDYGRCISIISLTTV